jgi:tellurite methyltransferase
VAQQQRYQGIHGEDLYRRLAMGEPVVVLDVRTEPEFVAGHIPGSILIPMHELEQRVPEVPNSDTPVAVVCEHGIRSVYACRFLAEHGLHELYNLEGGLDAWPGPLAAGHDRSEQHEHPIGPATFLVRNFDLLPKGLALDLAMGEGRNAIYLASRGFDVDGVDVNPDAVARARVSARKLGAPFRAVVGNVEDGTYIIPIDAYDVILVLHYLHRPLFRDIRDGLKPGGVVVYQTYTTQQLELGSGPRNPAHLLRPGELSEVFGDWEILRVKEGVEPGGPGRAPSALSGIVARKPAE